MLCWCLVEVVIPACPRRIHLLTAVHFLLRLYEKGIISHELALAKVKTLEKVGRYNPDIIKNVLKKIRKKEELK